MLMCGVCMCVNMENKIKLTHEIYIAIVKTTTHQWLDLAPRL